MSKISAILLVLLLSSIETSAFCGFYVAKAGASLFNKKSQVILVRDGQRTVVTMSNDFDGDVRDFAMVVPVPTILQENDIRVVNPALFDKLDSYSAPRMVEYHDSEPCGYYSYEIVEDEMELSSAEMRSVPQMSILDNKYKVTIEAEYEIEEYDEVMEEGVVSQRLFVPLG